MFDIGETIENRYRVFDRKRGGMGLVFLCEDLGTRRDGRPVRVAAKTLLPELHKTSGASDRFYNEASLWVELGKHPNILLALYVKRIDGYPFIFMEFVEGYRDRGVDLAGWIARGRLPSTVALNFGMQFCNGMMRAQRFFEGRGMRFVHRDVKPQNILINKNLRVKITDFGLSKAVPDADRVELQATSFGDDNAEDGLSKAGTVIGTPRYMAPEHWRNASSADIRSDVYAFGCVLYEMLTGAPAFRGKDLKELYDAHMKGLPRPPSAVVPGVSQKLDRIVASCVRRDPAARPGDFLELMHALTDAFRDEGGNASWVDPSALTDREDSIDDLLNKSLSLFELGHEADGVRLSPRRSANGPRAGRRLRRKKGAPAAPGARRARRRTARKKVRSGPSDGRYRGSGRRHHAVAGRRRHDDRRTGPHTETRRQTDTEESGAPWLNSNPSPSRRRST
ncbi:MAG: serine/threonine protein kinase [Deltaproteobacteria bacterium]|nr:serine/threonine protein kinase [Deltaproteobacteria bacterium]